MSNAVFPSLPGLDWTVTKTPTWKTSVQTTASGRELRTGYWSYPIWKFKLGYEFLRADASQELQTLMGFFLARQGQFDSFLYLDPNDNQVTNGVFGTGDGSTTAFQLSRVMGGFVEPVKYLNGTPAIYQDGAAVSASNYSVANGLVTFGTAPAKGASLTWSGQFYFNCRFLQDSNDFENFMKNLWQLKQIELLSVKA